MKNGFWILNLIQIFGYGFKLDPNIWIENLIQLFGSKMYVDWIIKNPIHDHS